MINRELEQVQTAIFDKYGVFFAFNNDQYEEKAVKGVKYISLGSGAICPKKNAVKFVDELAAESKKVREKTLSEKGKKEIIWYELGNHEAQISGDISSAVAAVECYGITEAEVKAEYPAYFDMCCEKDYF